MEYLQTINAWLNGLAQKADGGELFEIQFFVFFGMVIAERITHLIVQRHHYGDLATLSTLGVSGINLLVDTAFGGLLYYLIYTFLYESFRLFTFDYSLTAWLFAFLLHDFLYYVDHRISHRVGLFWAFHHVHHSSKEFNMAVAARGSLFNTWIAMPVFYLAAIVGVPILMFVAVSWLKSFYGIFNHTKFCRDWGPLEYILVTPSNHRVHHGAQVQYLDRNYGQVLMLWDILFGTFEREHEPPRYGLVHDIETLNPFKVQFAGLRWLYRQMASAPRWSDKLKYLVKPPGWRHDGRHETVEALRAASARDDVTTEDVTTAGTT